MLRGETSNSSGWASSIHNVDTHDILEYLRCAGICFPRLNTSSESFSLAQEDIFLAFEDVGRYPSPIPQWERRYSVPLHLMPTHQRRTLEVVQSMGAGHRESTLDCLIIYRSDRIKVYCCQ